MDIQPSFLDWYCRERENLDAVVLDIDGVLIRKGKALPASNILLETLRKDDTPLAILTNSADDSVHERCKTLSDAGLTVNPEDITSSGHALEPYVAKHKLQGSLFFMFGRLGNPCYAETAGLIVTHSVTDLENCSGVLVGEGTYDWQVSINGVVNFLRSRPNAHLICPNPDLYFPGENESIIIASGGITKFIVDILAANGTDIEPEYLGKPYSAIFNHCHHHLEQRVGRTIDKSRTVMVGDMIEGDTRGANDFGYRSVLLLSGGTGREMLSRTPTRPDMVFERL